MKLCVCPTCKVVSGGSMIIEIGACPWPADAVMSKAANSKQRDKPWWNRAVLMGALPKEIVYSKSALQRLLLRWKGRERDANRPAAQSRSIHRGSLQIYPIGKGGNNKNHNPGDELCLATHQTFRQH